MPITFTKSQLVARFPEFSAESDARVAAMLEMARDFVDEASFGSKATTALMLYTAHLLAGTSQSAAGTAGPMTSERVGDLARSYAAPAADANGLKASTYGQLYLKLANNEFAGGGDFVQAAFAEPE